MVNENESVESRRNGFSSVSEETIQDPITAFVENSGEENIDRGSAEETTPNLENSGPELSNKKINLQRFTIYNSSTTMYVVGSNAKESLFRIIEISPEKDSNSELTIIEDKSYFYTRKDMVELLAGLNESIEGGIHKIARAYGLLGFIKFTKGFYLSVVTKCSQVAILGGHFIYHVDETKLIPLDFDYRRPSKYSDEDKLLSIFKYLDLGKTFYFSYTYDITNSLQTNFLSQKRDAFKVFDSTQDNRATTHTEPNERFMWNNLLLQPVLNQPEVTTYEWFQPIIHGFVDQANVSIYGRKVYITIIARRSHHFAGARFLKRGVNDGGNVANEVETEQIVSDMLTTSFHDSKYGFYGNPRYTSFIQHRGSIPLYWTQDLNRLPKPPIEINLSDPFYQSSALHFNNLFQRYGSPIIILNLIKTKEKQPRESKLNNHFENCIKYLNQFLPDKDRLQYHSFDMSKFSRKSLDVISPIQNIAKNAIAQTGYFHNGKDFPSTKVQQGIVRTNCIDCLDRTNAAQFIICKEALSHQLQGLGLISSSTDLDYDSDLINILTEMFHDHGDTIAIQYGGSNLVNTMDSYRRINQWSSHTRDMLNSIKRIYSNSFMDSIRQEAINLFLGNYIYDSAKLRLWELQNDYHLHNNHLDRVFQDKPSYMHWYNEKLFKHTEASEIKDVFPMDIKRLETVADSSDNWFNECYGQRKFESFIELFQYNMNSNVRYFPSDMNSTSKNFDYSPFESRKPLFKKKLENMPDSGTPGSHSQVEERSLTETKLASNSGKWRGTSLSSEGVCTTEKDHDHHEYRSIRTKNMDVKDYADTHSKLTKLSHNFASQGPPSHIFPTHLDEESGVSIADSQIYQRYLEYPYTPIDLKFQEISQLRTSEADSDLYEKLTKEIQVSGIFTVSRSVNTSDLELYMQHAGDLLL